MNYDPNLNMSGRKSVQTVKLTLGQWDYRKEIIVEVRGNCSGLDVLRGAVNNAYENLKFVKCKFARGGEYATVSLENSDSSLECSDDEIEGEYWFERMVIAVEIIEIKRLKE